MFQPKRKSYTSALGFLVILSFSIAIILISNLQWEDRITITRGFCMFFIGIIYFTSLYYFLNNAALRTSVGQKLMKKYKLHVGDIYDVNNKYVFLYLICKNV